MFKRLGFLGDQLYEVEIVKSEIELREPRFVGFFILHRAKMIMIGLYYNFFDKYCEVTKTEELEVDTDSFYLALTSTICMIA